MTLPFATDTTSLTSAIEITGDSVDPASGTPQNFTSPVRYTVTAADGSSKAYTVTVSVARSSAKNITRFEINGVTGDIGEDTISLTLPFGTDPTSLTPAIEITGDSVDPASGTPQNFTSPVRYTVTAADGSSKVYTVTVSVARSSAKSITRFDINGVTGDIGEDTISLTLPFGTDTTSLTPTIEITGDSVDPASGTPQNFTSPVRYTVTAADGSSKAYTVTVSVARSSAKNITRFEINGVTGDIGEDTISLTLPFG